MRAVVLLALLFGCQGRQTTYDTAGSVLDFALLSLDSDTVRLSDYRGNVVVLNFWATWCRPCLEEIPELAALHNGVDGLMVLGISLDNLRDKERIAAFAEQLAIPYPVLLGDSDAIDQVGNLWALPTTIVLDTTGRITESIEGIAPIRAMTPALRSMTPP